MAAFAEITPIEIRDMNTFTEVGTSATRGTVLATNGETSATFGAYFTMDGKDEQYLILIENKDADGVTDLTVTIKAGNGIQGVADVAKTDLGNGEFTLIQIDSGRFKNVTENETLKELSSAVASTQVPAKGKVFITGTSAEIAVTVFKMVI
jgi:hypothetical protein